ncbi:MAG: peptide deformylase [Candidatus Dormibacteria bacterium]
MIREIVKVEDARLRTKCPRVPKVDQDIQRLIDDMVDTMRGQGIGLAAPQVGVLLRVIVCDVDDHLHVIVNPEIVRTEGSQVGIEGCLSIPGYVGEVERHERVVVKGRNRNGKEIRVKAEGLLSRCLQHEIDHVDGILFTDRLTDPATFRRVDDGEDLEDAEGGAHPEGDAAGELVGAR